MLKQPITILVHTSVGGPDGSKLFPNHVYEVEDGEYTRVLIKSGLVSLIDPPSLDPKYLEENNYELCEGYSYDSFAQVGSEPESTPAKEPEKPYMMKGAKKSEASQSEIKESAEPVKKSAEESTSEPSTETTPEVIDHEPKNRELTPPLYRGVTTSAEEK